MGQLPRWITWCGLSRVAYPIPARALPHAASSPPPRVHDAHRPGRRASPRSVLLAPLGLRRPRGAERCCRGRRRRAEATEPPVSAGTAPEAEQRPRRLETRSASGVAPAAGGPSGAGSSCGRRQAGPRSPAQGPRRAAGARGCGPGRRCPRRPARPRAATRPPPGRARPQPAANQRPGPGAPPPRPPAQWRPSQPGRRRHPVERGLRLAPAPGIVT